MVAFILGQVSGGATFPPPKSHPLPAPPTLPRPGASYAQAIDTIGEVELEEEWLCKGIEGREGREKHREERCLITFTSTPRRPHLIVNDLIASKATGSLGFSLMMSLAF